VSWPAMRALAAKDRAAAQELLGQATFAPYPGYRRLLNRLLRAHAPAPARTKLVPVTEARAQRDAASDAPTVPPASQSASVGPSEPPPDSAVERPGRAVRAARDRSLDDAEDALRQPPPARRTVPPKAAESTIPKSMTGPKSRPPR
jgi:hypothetical protein